MISVVVMNISLRSNRLIFVCHGTFSLNISGIDMHVSWSKKNVFFVCDILIFSFFVSFSVRCTKHKQKNVTITHTIVNCVSDIVTQFCF